MIAITRFSAAGLTLAALILGACSTPSRLEGEEYPRPSNTFGFSSAQSVEYAVAGLCVTAVLQGKTVQELVEKPGLDYAHRANNLGHPVFRDDDVVYKLDGTTRVFIAGGAQGCDVMALSGDGPELLEAVLKGLEKRSEPWEAALIDDRTRNPETVRTLLCTPTAAAPEAYVLLTTIRKGASGNPKMLATVGPSSGRCGLRPVDEVDRLLQKDDSI